MYKRQVIDNPDSLAEVLEISDYAESCRFKDCKHINEPGCAVLEAVNSGVLDYKVYASYLKLRREAWHFSASEQMCIRDRPVRGGDSLNDIRIVLLPYATDDWANLFQRLSSKYGLSLIHILFLYIPNLAIVPLYRKENQQWHRFISLFSTTSLWRRTI